MISFINDLEISCSDFQGEHGATALEYAVLASCIAAVAVFGIRNLGLTVGGLYDRAVTQIGIYF